MSDAVASQTKSAVAALYNRATDVYPPEADQEPYPTSPRFSVKP